MTTTTKMRWQDKALAATKGTRFGAILNAAMGKTIDAPRFNGKAAITSDGFVMCSFTSSDGREHYGAFVGAASDLVQNATGLAAHLSLNDAERKELFALVRGWVETDYTGGKALAAISEGK